MRVALVHDYIKEYGGAERVLEALHELYPNAPVFTSIYLPHYLGPHRERFKNWDIRTSYFQYVPFNAKLISPFRIVAPCVFSRFDFSKFDVVIVSATGAYFPNLINKKNAIQICYSHTPPRYLYGYATAREWKKTLILRSIGEIANHFLRIADYKSSKNVDYYIANSHNIAGRIKKFYRREATVIYPPVDIQASSSIASSVQVINKELNANHLDAKRYYLAGGRLARPKHIDLIVEACLQLGVPLKVFGKGFAGYEKELQHRSFNKKDGNIEFVGEVSDEEKWQLMRNAKAYIFAAEDEDFGITPVEAMSFGIPVIAYRSGGVVESVIEGKTGLFFNDLSVSSVISAIEKFATLTFSEDVCKKQSEKFSKERFKKEIKTFVEKVTRQ